MKASYVSLDQAQPGEAVVVIDVLRAFTTVAWAFDRGARRVLAVDTPAGALALRDSLPDGSLVAGEEGGRRIDGFDLGNSPSEIQHADVADRQIVLRTSAGTQGLARTAGSGVALAASFVVAAATARHLADRDIDHVEFVITGASLGRDGDEDLACAELIVAMVSDPDVDPGPFVARIATSDAGRSFLSEDYPWMPAGDLDLASEVDRFTFALTASHDATHGAIELLPDTRPT